MTRAAKSLETIRHQINALWPNRSKISDGGIGDKAHKSRQSDHNEDANGVYHARDFTHDPINGPSGRALANAIAKSKDSRVKYMISEDEIMSGNDGPSPWVWRPYNRKNPKRNKHTHHMHLSVRSANGDLDHPWDLSAYVHPNTKGVAVTRMQVLRKGDKGSDVKHLQILLNNKRGANLVEDGDFGEATETAVENFQRAEGLHPDGVVGPYTWDELGVR